MFWEINPHHIKKFTVDTSVDLALSGGAAISVGINHKFIGDSPRSMVECAKDGINYWTDKAGEYLGKVFW